VIERTRDVSHPLCGASNVVYAALASAEDPMRREAELAELIVRTAQRDLEAFRVLYEATSPLLMGISLRVLGGRHDLAEEAVQDAYVTIWHQAATFDELRGSARGWLAVIARRRAVDRLRASPWLQHEAPGEEAVAVSLESLPDTLTLRTCLQQLDKATRHAIVLSYVYGMSHSELSRKVGTPLGTIKSRLRRGMIALRQCLQS
jgi:RNA polymerase sigma-70 factor (ECF subfamily)